MEMTRLVDPFSIVLISLVFLITGCKNQLKEQEQPQTLSEENTRSWTIDSIEIWNLNKGLLNPESIIYNPVEEEFYISNGQHYRPGTAGFISKVSRAGELLERKWIEGLNRPTGMAIKGSALYAADVNRLLEVNLKDGTIIKEYEEPITNSGLNDVAVNDKGEVFVTASFVHSIFKLSDGRLTQWVQDTARLQWANGIIANDKVVTVAGLNISTIDMLTGSVDFLNPQIKIFDFDGIRPDGSGGYFLTTVEQSALHHINAQMSHSVLKSNGGYFGDFEFLSEDETIYVPMGQIENDSFFISVFHLK